MGPGGTQQHLSNVNTLDAALGEGSRLPRVPVTVDFARESFVERLREAGFDPAQRTEQRGTAVAARREPKPRKAHVERERGGLQARHGGARPLIRLVRPSRHGC